MLKATNLQTIRLAISAMFNVGTRAHQDCAPIIYRPQITSAKTEAASRLPGCSSDRLFSQVGLANAGALALNQLDIATQVLFRKEEIRKCETRLCSKGLPGKRHNLKVFTSQPAHLQGRSCFSDNLQSGLLEADHIVVAMARQMLGQRFVPDYVRDANQARIERVLV